jgi:hypothetical protein
LKRYKRADNHDADAVWVTLWEFGGRIRGSVRGPQELGSERGTIPIVGQKGSLSAEQAIAYAENMAAPGGHQILVADPDHLWLTEWGELVD